MTLTVNSKGYKVLDSHIKAIYGDSITLQRCEGIYQILEENGFASSNITLGVGSFSMQCMEENGKLKPFTRDTFCTCIKATYCEIGGKTYPIFKDPKEGGFKKSHKGCCVVRKTDKGSYTVSDGYTWEEACKCEDNAFRTVFRDGTLIREQSLQEIRNRLHNNRF